MMDIVNVRFNGKTYKTPSGHEFKTKCEVEAFFAGISHAASNIDSLFEMLNIKKDYVEAENGKQRA